jgi:hypothetical protein
MDHAKETYVGVVKKIHPFFISAIEGGESLYLSGKELPEHWILGWLDILTKRKNFIRLPGLQS